MQFNSNDSGSGLQSEINITPLVDVVLVLLIIFMVVVPLLMEGYDVDIPRAAAAEDTSAEAAEEQVVLSIGSTTCPILTPPAQDGIPQNCQVTLADQEIPASELPARVAEILGPRPSEQRALFLAIDDRLNYEGVLRIIDLAKSGVEDLKIEFVATN
jgi:biopolymer transport protein ExbD